MITAGAILRGAVRRFFPTAGAGALAILLVFDGRAVLAIHPSGWTLLAAMLGAATGGFAALLWQVRSRLRIDADVAGRRSVIAGGLGIVGLFSASIFSQGAGVAWALLLAFASGAVAGLATYWPWLGSRMSPVEPGIRAAVDSAALPLSPFVPTASMAKDGVPLRHSTPDA